MGMIDWYLRQREYGIEAKMPSWDSFVTTDNVLDENEDYYITDTQLVVENTYYYSR
jgi:hypothetical protein